MPEPIKTPARARKVIGILGGLGPYSHLALEAELLEAANRLVGAAHDQDYPEWIVSSVPQTPDRTRAIAGEADDPMPMLLRSLRRLEGHLTADGTEVSGADFVIIACNTAHYYLPALRRTTHLPIFDLIDEAAKHVGRRSPGARVGVLATTGTLKSGLYQQALLRHGLSPVSLLDAKGGALHQRALTMEAIYGPFRDGRFLGGGIKAQGASQESREMLTTAAEMLASELEAQLIIAGCTEISLALPKPVVAGMPLVDPLEVIAKRAIEEAYGL